MSGLSFEASTEHVIGPGSYLWSSVEGTGRDAGTYLFVSGMKEGTNRVGIMRQERDVNL